MPTRGLRVWSYFKCANVGRGIPDSSAIACSSLDRLARSHAKTCAVVIMTDNNIGLDICAQSHSACVFAYAVLVGKDTIRDVLWQNVRALMIARYGREHLNRFAADAGMAVGNIQRIKRRSTSIGIDIIETIAVKFGLECWQLLVPGLIPDDLPVLRGGKKRELIEQVQKLEQLIQEVA